MTASIARAAHAHPGTPTLPLPLTVAQRAALEAAIRPATAEKRIVQRARARLLMAEGWTAAEIARRVGAGARSVERWRARFATAADPLAALADAPRSGRPRSFVRAT